MQTIFTRLSLSLILCLTIGYKGWTQCPAPTSVTATPNVFCAGQTVQLNATTTGIGIAWYTDSLGGTSIGSSMSGVDFSVMPSATTTYYAEGIFPSSRTFSYIGAPDTFTVPTGVTSIDIQCWGAQGGANWVNNVNYGGYTTGTLAVTPGEVLNIYVGGQSTSLLGGFNGGGNGEGAGKGGGGASDVRQGGNTYADRKIVAGGAGGAGYWSNLHVVGGLGGGLTGGNGYRVPDYGANPGGEGGTQVGSGTGTCVSLYNPIMAGGFGYGGGPANCGCESYGGGGGWYGGAGSGNCRGGGGGSSYIGGVTNGTVSQGVRIGNGEVIFSWTGACVPANRTAVTVTEIFPPTPTISTNSPMTICAGVPVTLTYTGGAAVQEYLWYKNGVPVNSTLTPSNTYSGNSLVNGNNELALAVAYSSSPTCLSDTTSIIITQLPLPYAAMQGLASFCANTPAPIYTSPGMSNYVWKRSTTIVQSGLANSYTPTVSGNHNVTLTDANGCTKTSAWMNIVVKPIPTANAGIDKNLCEGASVQIGSTNNAANTYTWSPTTALSNPNISNPIASPLSTTTYTVEVYNTQTGCFNSDMMVINSLTPPTVPSLSSTTTPVCQGASISINPNAVGASSINWYKNGVLMYNQPTNFILSVTLPTVSADAYTIAAKGQNTCLSGLSNVVSAWVKEAAVPTINANPQAVNGVSTVCVPGGTSGNSILLANSTTPSPTYSWKLAGNFIAGANQSSYLANVNMNQSIKSMSVQATYPNGCARTSSNLTVKLVTSGCTPRLGSDKEDAETLIEETLSVGLYPNPTTGILQVNINHSEDNEGKIVLYNALGQIVLEKTINLSAGQASEELDLNHLAAGVYSLSFDTAKEHSIQKVVKE